MPLKVETTLLKNVYAEGARLMVFGLVGLVATGVHITVAYLAVYVNVSPMLASGCGFMVALPCSWFGHRTLTFRSSAHKSFIKFCAVACGGFLGSLVVLTFLEPIVPWVALLLSILVIPGISYVLSRLWVFRQA